MPMDIELQSIKDPSKRIKVLYPHWEGVLKPQGQWIPVEEAPKEEKENGSTEYQGRDAGRSESPAPKRGRRKTSKE